MEKILYAAVIALAWIAKELVTYFLKQKQADPESRQGPTTGEMAPEYWLVILNDIKAKIETVGHKVEGNNEDTVAIRNHLHEVRNLLSPLGMAVQFLIEEIKRKK